MTKRELTNGSKQEMIFTTFERCTVIEREGGGGGIIDNNKFENKSSLIKIHDFTKLNIYRPVFIKHY